MQQFELLSFNLLYVYMLLVVQLHATCYKPVQLLCYLQLAVHLLSTYRLPVQFASNTAWPYTACLLLPFYLLSIMCRKAQSGNELRRLSVYCLPCKQPVCLLPALQTVPKQSPSSQLGNLLFAHSCLATYCMLI